MVTKKQKIIELIKYGVTDVSAISRRTHCSKGYIYKIARGHGYIVSSKDRDFIYSGLTVQQVLDIHEKIILSGGKAHGVLNESTIEFTLNRAQRYKELSMRLAIIIQGIAERHPFNGGNKRTALAVGDICLDEYGLELSLRVKDTIKFMKSVASYEYNLKEIADWITEYVDLYSKVKKEVETETPKIAADLISFFNVGKKVRLLKKEIEDKKTPDKKLYEELNAFTKNITVPPEKCYNRKKEVCRFCEILRKLIIKGELTTKRAKDIRRKADWLIFHSK